MINGEDIVMVYNVTSRRLNSSIWATHFALFMVWSNLRVLYQGAYMVDQDIGEMF